MRSLGQAQLMTPRDTNAAAHAAQVAVARRLGREQRLRLGAEMSEDTRTIALEGMQRRHPEYTHAEARRALFRALWGEAFASRVWGSSPQR